MNTSKRPYYLSKRDGTIVATIIASSFTEVYDIAEKQLIDFDACTTVEPPAPPRTPGEVLDDTIDATKQTFAGAKPRIQGWLSKVLGKASHKLAPKTTTEHGATLVQS